MKIDEANKASEALVDAAQWLEDELAALLPESDTRDAIIALAEHVTTEALRTAVLCALAKAEANGAL